MIDEILDIVNENDEVIGQKFRSDIYKEGICNFRVINAFLINKKEEIWIPIRSSTKKLFPSCLDASVGGHVTSGESYEEAFRRELKEELNLELDKVNYSFVGKLNPYSHQVSAFMHLYLIHTNETPTYNQDDFVGFQWITINNALKLINEGAPAKTDLSKLLQFLSFKITPNQIILECKRVKFYSPKDKDAFFEWIKRISCVSDFKGSKDKILIFVNNNRISNEDLHDFFGLFRRYTINIKQLEVFLNDENEELFNRYKQGYSICIYPSK